MLHILLLAAFVAVPLATMAQTYEPLPYSTGFEGISTGSQPDGWTAIQTGVNGSTIFPCAYNYSGNTHSGSVYYEFESSSSSSDTEIVALPYMQNISSLMLTMWVSASSSYPCSLEVGVLEDDNTFTSLQTLDLITFSGGSAWASNYHEYTVFTAAYTGSGERLAMRAVRTGSGQFTLFIDDLTVSEFSGCYPLSNLVSTASTSSSISLSWTDGMNSSVSYTVSYWADGSEDTIDVSYVTDTFYTVTDLEAMTAYHFMVTPNCPDGDGNPVTGTFSTECEGSTCELTFDITDSYGDGWNGNAIRVYQAGSMLASVTISSGNSSTETVSVCSTAPVQLIFYKGSYADEMGGTVSDGGGGTLFTISGMNNRSTGDTLAVTDNPCPTCIPPLVVAADVQQESITLSWTPRSASMGYVIYNEGEEETYITDTFYTFTSLASNTLYTFGVQALCSDDDSSNIASINVRTACGDIVLPYTETFEGYENGAFPPCWHRLRAYGSDPSVNNQYNGTTGGSMSMYLRSYMDTNLFVTPSAVPADGDNIYVRYKAYMERGDDNTWLKVGVMTDTSDISTFVMLDSVGYHNFNYSFEEREFNTASLDATESYFIAWMFYGEYSLYNYYYSTGGVDDIYISEIPSCLRVNNLVADSIDSTSITLVWSDGVNSGATYTVVNLNNDDEFSGISDTTYTITDLTPNTLYTFSVTVNCGSEDAEAVTISVRTGCGVTVIPYTEGFEDAGALSCWQVLNPSYSTGRSTAQAHTGSASFLLYYGSQYSYLVSPELGGTDNGMRLQFYHKKYSSYYDETIQVGYSTTGDSVEAFIWGEEVACTSDWTLFDAIYPAGTKYVAVKYVSYSNYGLYIDDLNFMLPPDCMPVSELMVDTATALTANDATIIWQAGSEDQGMWYVMLDSTIHEAYTTMYTLTGLSPRTTYTAYVAADCSGDTSEWQSITFTTACPDGECTIEVTSSCNSSYVYSSYCPTLEVYQNNELTATVLGETKTVSVCSGMPVNILYTSPNYTYYTPMATVIDGGGADIFDGETDSYSTGDTLVYLSNPCPTCITPSGLVATYVDSNSIYYAWTVDNSVMHYQVSFNGGNWTTPSTAGEYFAYGLDGDSVYTMSVRAVCAVGDTSYHRTISTRTTCGWMTIPYSEGFESSTPDERPACWYPVSGSATVGDNSHSGDMSLSMVSSGAPAMVASQPIPLPGDSIYVSFWAKAGSYSYYAGTLEAGVLTNPLADSTFTPMVSITSSDYAHYEFNTSTLSADSVYYLAFRFTNSSSYYNADIDDINVRLDEGCMYPSNLVATPDSSLPQVTVTWTNAGSVSNFVVSYRQGTGAWSTPVDVTSTSYTFDGLNYSTTYEFRIGLVCNDDTLWSSVNGATPCGLQALPYYENFYSATGELPPCWDYTNSGYFHWNRWTTHAETSGDGEMMAGSGSAGEAAILPAFGVPIVKIEISFDAKLGNISEGDGMMMGVYDDATDVVTWLDTLQIAGQSRENFVRFTYNYLTYGGGYGDRIAIGHSHNNSSDWGFALDSIIVLELPDCNPPENVTANNTMYPNTADDVFFTWTVSGDNPPSQWQVYIDTITSTIAIDSVDESQLITVDTNYYHVPVNMLAEGAHYRFFVRSVCMSGFVHSNWVELQNGFATDEFWMNQGSNFDTIVGCDFIIYDNGGPVAGYLHNSNSNLIIQAGEAGRELQIQGGFFSHGADANTLTVYDGVGTTGAVLYTRTNTNMSETIDSVLATSTTGALTITFTSGYYAALGYELYIHCVGAATCPKPTNLAVEMTSATTAHATWDATGATSYRVYHRVEGASIWNMLGTTTNSVDFTALPADTMYEFCVVGVCSATDTSAASIIRHFSTHYVEPCDPVSDVTVGNIAQTTATVDWTSTGSQWEVAIIGGTTVSTSTKPYTLTGLTANTQYQVAVRNVCNEAEGYYSDWSDTVTFLTMPEDVATYTITVNANNDAWGTVTGGGTYAEGTTVTLTATANDGYHFEMWSDGNTDATRTITVTADASYTANFAEDGQVNVYYTITVTSNNDAWGTVTGGGTYVENSTVTITATANSGYKFVEWQDGNTNASRTITVTADATYTATFAEDNGIDDVDGIAGIVLYPNPASSNVTIDLNGFDGTALVSIIDLNGRTCGEWKAENGKVVVDVTSFARGAYFVRVTSENASAIRKLVVK